MKNCFYKNWNILLQIITLFILLDTIFFTLIFIFIDDVHFIRTIIYLLSFFIFTEVIIFLIGGRIFFSKFEITKNGIMWTLFKRELMLIKWNDVLSVKKSYIGNTQSLSLSLKTGDLFSFNVNKKILNTLINACNNEKLMEEMKKVRLLF